MPPWPQLGVASPPPHLPADQAPVLCDDHHLTRLHITHTLKPVVKAHTCSATAAVTLRMSMPCPEQCGIGTCLLHDPSRAAAGACCGLHVHAQTLTVLRG
jgi:hypothetical protein